MRAGEGVPVAAEGVAGVTSWSRQMPRMTGGGVREVGVDKK